MSQTSASPPAIIDCFACRAIGTGAFAGLGLFSIYTARSYGSNKAISAGPGAIWGIRLAGYGELRVEGIFTAKRTLGWHLLIVELCTQ